MTMGPAPMMSTLLMSVRLGTPALLHHLYEAIEEIPDVVRPGTGFGVPLEAKRWPVGACEALPAAIEERYVGGLEVRRERVRVDRKAVVLAGDDDRSPFQVFYRVVCAVMPELHLHGPGSGCEAHKLVAQADPESRNPGVDDLADGAYGVVAGFRVARTVRQEHPVGPERKGIRSRRLRRKNRDPAAVIDEHAQYVAFYAVVVRDDVKARLGALAEPAAGLPPPFGPLVGPSGRHDLRQIHSCKTGKSPRGFHGLVCVIGAREHGAVLGAFFAKDPSEASRVDARDRDHLVRDEKIGEIPFGPPARDRSGHIPDHQTRGEHLSRLQVLAVGSGIADVRMGQRDDLAAIRWVGEDLLISGDGRVENDLPRGEAGRSGRRASKDS